MRSHKLTQTSHVGVLESEDFRGNVTLDIFSAGATVKIKDDQVHVTHHKGDKLRTKVLRFAGDFNRADTVGYMLAGRFANKAGKQFIPRTIN